MRVAGSWLESEAGRKLYEEMAARYYAVDMVH